MRRPPVVRVRNLSEGQRQRLRALHEMARVLDSAFVVPGTSFRVGLDPILGLLPGLGDLVSPVFTMSILWQARDLALPRVVQLRMIFNVAIDALFGTVPVLGDLFDAAWKANEKNMALLERHALEDRAASPADWAFVAILIVVLVAIALTPFLLLGWFVATVAGLFA